MANTLNSIRVVAPSRSLSIVDERQIARAKQRLGALGFRVSLGRSVYNSNWLDVVPLSERQSDFQEAIEDTSVDIVMSAIGGCSSAELIPFISTLSINACNKVFVGMSDVTSLLNFISLKLGVRAICGPHFSSFGAYFRQPYLEQMFVEALQVGHDGPIPYPQVVGNENWHVEQELWATEKNSGPLVVIPGCVEGPVVGGNLPTLVGRLGKLCSEIPSVILLVEIHSGYNYLDFIKWLHSIIFELGKPRISALCLGKLPWEWRSSKDHIDHLFAELRGAYEFPTVIECDFGHNMPFFSFEIGSKFILNTEKEPMFFRGR